MQNKNSLKLSAIILVIIGIVLISLSFIVSDEKEMNNNQNNDNSNADVKPSTSDDEKPPLSYESVLEMANSLYGGDGVTIEVIDEGDKFVINCIYNSTGNVEHIFVDKATGSISSVKIEVS